MVAAILGVVIGLALIGGVALLTRHHDVKSDKDQE